MSTQGKGTIVFALLALLTFLGIATFQTSYLGFDFDFQVHSVSMIGNGQYKLSLSLEVTNTNEYDVEILSGKLIVFSDESKAFTIFSYEISNKISIESGEMYKTDRFLAYISLENDNIPNEVYFVMENVEYLMNEQYYDINKEFWFEFDLSDYLP